MLHPDYQYDPTLLPALTEPIRRGGGGRRLRLAPAGRQPRGAGDAVVEVRGNRALTKLETPAGHMLLMSSSGQQVPLCFRKGCDPLSKKSKVWGGKKVEHYCTVLYCTVLYCTDPPHVLRRLPGVLRNKRGEARRLGDLHSEVERGEGGHGPEASTVRHA